MLACTGLALFALNGYGLLQSLRPAVLDEAGGTFASSARVQSSTVEEFEAIARCSTREMVQRISELAHRTIRHIRPEELRQAGLENGEDIDLLNLRVPVWENYILHVLSYLKTDTYRRYEFCDYRKSFERGIGACGQKALAAVSFLHSHGVETGFIDWKGHHAVAIARVSDEEWWVLDPEYGVAFPYPFDRSAFEEGQPLLNISRALVAQYPNLTTLHHAGDLIDVPAWEVYPATGQIVRFGGPAARWKRAFWVESAAYVLKWVLPGLLLVPFLGLLLRRRAGRPSPVLSKNSVVVDRPGSQVFPAG